MFFKSPRFPEMTFRFLRNFACDLIGSRPIKDKHSPAYRFFPLFEKCSSACKPVSPRLLGSRGMGWLRNNSVAIDKSLQVAATAARRPATGFLEVNHCSVVIMTLFIIYNATSYIYCKICYWNSHSPLNGAESRHLLTEWRTINKLQLQANNVSPMVAIEDKLHSGLLATHDWIAQWTELLKKVLSCNGGP